MCRMRILQRLLQSILLNSGKLQPKLFLSAITSMQKRFSSNLAKRCSETVLTEPQREPQRRYWTPWESIQWAILRTTAADSAARTIFHLISSATSTPLWLSSLASRSLLKECLILESELSVTFLWTRRNSILKLQPEYMPRAEASAA